MKEVVMMRIMLGLIVAGALGCGAGVDAPWVGTYTTVSTWDISGPLAGGRTVGDAIADLLVDKIVGLSGVPSVLEEDAQELVSSLIRDDVKSAVDLYVPETLSPTGAMTVMLGETLANVTVESTLHLEEGLLPNSLEGSETIDKLTFEHEGILHDLLPLDLLADAGAEMEAEWSGSEDGETALEIDPHGVALQYGELVQRVALQLVDAAGLTQLKDDVAAAVDCNNVIADILDGEPAVELSVSSWSYSVDSTDLADACSSAQGLIGDRVLGMFARDSGVLIGGSLHIVGGDPAEGLTSASDFGGIVNVAPAAIAPRIDVELDAVRR
jgi:hypothetical protein